MSVTPGCRLVAHKGFPRANPGLIINESYGFVGGFGDVFWGRRGRITGEVGEKGQPRRQAWACQRGCIRGMLPVLSPALAGRNQRR